MKRFAVVMTVTGRASGIVMAETKEEAEARATRGEFEEEVLRLIEWSMEDIEEIEDESSV